MSRFNEDFVTIVLPNLKIHLLYFAYFLIQTRLNIVLLPILLKNAETM